MDVPPQELWRPAEAPGGGPPGIPHALDDGADAPEDDDDSVDGGTSNVRDSGVMSEMDDFGDLTLARSDYEPDSRCPTCGSSAPEGALEDFYDPCVLEPPAEEADPPAELDAEGHDGNDGPESSVSSEACLSSSSESQEDVAPPPLPPPAAPPEEPLPIARRGGMIRRPYCEFAVPRGLVAQLYQAAHFLICMWRARIQTMVGASLRERV